MSDKKKLGNILFTIFLFFGFTVSFAASMIDKDIIHISISIFFGFILCAGAYQSVS